MEKKRTPRCVFRTYEVEVHLATLYNRETKAEETLELTTIDGVTVSEIPEHCFQLTLELVRTESVRVEMSHFDFFKLGTKIPKEVQTETTE